MKKLITSALLLLVATVGCKVTDTTGIRKIFRYVNESGVEVALVGQHNPFYNIEDSTVIPSGETFECSLDFPEMDEGSYSTFPYKLGGPDENPPIDYIPIKVYYNKNICKSYIETDKGKTPADLNNGSYTITRTSERKKKIRTYTYTFTAEDYQNALKAQK